MATAIDSEAAYRFLSEQLVKETGAFSKGVNKGLNIARSAMRNPDAIPTITPPNEWVSVEERLPPLGKNVLVYVYWHEHCGVYMGWSHNHGWIVFCGIESRPDMRVTHWMSLPEPPDRRPPEGEV